MLIRDLYQKYQIMPQLATHMLRVAGVGKLITDSWNDRELATKSVIACLVHDLGNLAKFRLEPKYQDEWGPKVYLDESSMGNRSVYMYGVSDWDGCSVDVNSTTNEPIEKITNLALITRSYSDKVMDRMICCNWLPTTERDTQRMIPSFIEHFHAGTAPRAHLSTPLVTGGQIVKSNADVAKEVYEALSEGILYFHIGNSAYAETTPSLLGHFYPITAKEAWPGTVIGTEKIITTKSRTA
ncbi:MAG: hypothetical protein UX64_C0002G0001, partial [Microgenomates group bacterium GW2011_GWC2_46_7]